MDIYPAIDIINGKAVRLTKGDYSTAEVLADDVLAVAESFAAAGATRMHVVDLDGAKSGALGNFEIISALTTRTNTFVEVGGGVRDGAKLKSYIDAGASRVIIGTAAVKNFAFVEESVGIYGDKIAVGIDCKDGFVAVSGWQEVSKISGIEFAAKCRDAGVKTVIYTDIDTDGAMKGTNIAAFEELSKIKGLDIIASGGVSSLDEVRKLKEIGVAGVILGKAIYHGLINLADAVKIAKE